MDIEWFRDLVLIIFGLVATGVFIMMAVILLSLYRQVRAIQKSLSKALAIIEAISAIGSEFGKTFSQASNLVSTIKDKFGFIKKTFTGKSKENEKSGQGEGT